MQEVASRTQSLNDVLKQRPLAGIAPRLEAEIISANLLTFQRQERESTLAEKTIAAELNQLCGRSANAPLTVNANPIVFTAALRAELSGGGPLKFVRYSHSTGRARSAGLQGRLVEERAVSGHCRRAVLFAGKCNRSGATIRARDLVTAAACGTATQGTLRVVKRVSNKRRPHWLWRSVKSKDAYANRRRTGSKASRD